MNTEQFEQIVNERCQKIKDVLTTKAREYATDKDRLHNFNRGAQITGQTREKVLHGFMMKHFISYLDILDNVDKGIYPSQALVDEKIGDIINYFILMEACFKEGCEDMGERHLKEDSSPGVPASRSVENITEAIRKATRNFERGFGIKTLMSYTPKYDKLGRIISADRNYRAGIIDIDGEDYTFVRRGWEVRIYKGRASYMDMMNNNPIHINKIDLTPDYLK